MSCEHNSLSLELRPSEAVSSAYKWGKTVPNGGTQNENWRAAMFVDEDCWQQVRRYDLRTRDCLYGESRELRYEGCCSMTSLYNSRGVNPAGDRGDTSPQNVERGDGNTSCPPQIWCRFCSGFSWPVIINIFILVFYCVRCFNTASFAS